MTRDELLKKCVERGVADEPTVSSVSHLFYVFLLSALQRGQRVEIPDFGTFGTRVVGIKRTRKMPFFEPDADLAGAVNERYRDMKFVVVGRYEEHPLEPGATYTGKEPPYDPVVDQVGKEVIVDTHQDVSAGMVEALQKKSLTLKKEKPAMPKFNLKGEEEGGNAAPPALHDEDEDRGPGPLMQVLIAILILALLTLALHFFGVIRLWGPAEVQQATLPEPVIQQPQPVAVDTVVTPTPVPTQKPKPPVKSTTGRFTVQVSSWETKFKANDEMSRLNAANFDAFVEEGTVNGERWYRVRVGRYETRAEATTAAEQLGRMLEDGAWVTKVGS